MHQEVRLSDEVCMKVLNREVVNRRWNVLDLHIEYSNCRSRARHDAGADAQLARFDETFALDAMK